MADHISLRQLRLPINNLLVDLYLISNGTIVIVPGFGFSKVYDHFPEGVSGVFEIDGWSLFEKGSELYNYSYNTAYLYKQEPLMKAWLCQQNLTLPEGV